MKDAFELWLENELESLSPSGEEGEVIIRTDRDFQVIHALTQILNVYRVFKGGIKEGRTS